MNTLYCKGYVKAKYPVYLSDDVLFKDLYELLPTPQKRFIIIDARVVDLFPALVNGLEREGTYIIPIVASEENKSLKGIEEIFDIVFSSRPSRDDIIVAIGGGMIMNLGGLAASLIMRGMKFYYVPTTLTGQIDASMGSKQAVNYKQAKNWLGTFNDPEFCYINPHLLTTTSKREFNSQAIEGMKLCLATDKELFLESFDTLMSLNASYSLELMTFIEKMIQAKLAVVEIDLTEENYGMSMLYGHTIGHAIEMLDYQHINHGEGVGLGMLAAARISCLLGLADEKLVAVHEEVLNRLGLPLKIPDHIAVTDIINKLSHNKKNYNGEVRFVLLADIGEMVQEEGVYYRPVPVAIIEKAIKKGY